MKDDWKKAKHRQWSHEIQNVMRISNDLDKAAAAGPISVELFEQWTLAVFQLGCEDLFSYTAMLASIGSAPDVMVEHFRCLCFYAHAFGLEPYVLSLSARIKIMEEAIAFIGDSENNEFEV